MSCYPRNYYICEGCVIFLRVSLCCSVCVICQLAVFQFAHRCHTSTMPEGIVGVGVWVFCFIYTSQELSDYASDVVCDRSPLEVLESTKGPCRHACILLRKESHQIELNYKEMVEKKNHLILTYCFKVLAIRVSTCISDICIIDIFQDFSMPPFN